MTMVLHEQTETVCASGQAERGMLRTLHCGGATSTRAHKTGPLFLTMSLNSMTTPRLVLAGPPRLESRFRTCHGLGDEARRPVQGPSVRSCATWSRGRVRAR